VGDEIFDRLNRAVVEMDVEGAQAAARAALNAGIDAYDAVVRGLAKGMEEAGRLYDEGEYWVPELICCADSMYAGLQVLRPYIAAEVSSERPVAVLGAVEGDVHDIGKNIVVMMLDAAGFDVHDLGHNVPSERFVSAACEKDAVILGLSSLMTTTRDRMREVIELVAAREEIKECHVLVGGAAVTEAFAKRIGADGYARDALEAVRVANRLVARGGAQDAR